MTYPISTYVTDAPPKGQDDRATMSSFPRGAGFTLVVMAYLAAYSATFVSLLEPWLDYGSHYSHGLLVVAVVGFLLWDSRTRLALGETRPVVQGLLVVAVLFASLGWFVAVAAGVQVPGILAALAVAWIALAAVLGRYALWRLIPHFALLLSVVPIWQPILNPPLQFMATHVVNDVLRTLGLTIFMDGNSIVMPDITFEIVGGCSGLGYLLVAFTLGIYITLAYRLRFWPGLLMVLGFAGLALVSNWLRIALIMLVGYEYGATHRLVHDHVWFGWVVFSVIFLPVLFLVVRRIPVAAKAAPQVDPAPRIRVPALAGVLAALLAFPLLYATLVLHGRLTAATPTLDLPAPTASHVRVAADGAWQPEYPHATLTSLDSFRSDALSGGPAILLYQAHYARQSDGIEVIDSGNDLAGSTWTRDGQEGHSEAMIAGAVRPVREMQLVDSSGARMLVWFWFRIGDTHVDTDLRAKLEQVLWKLRLRPDAAVFAVATLCEAGNCNRAAEALGKFTAELDIDALGR